jgi:hypothetical protein
MSLNTCGTNLRYMPAIGLRNHELPSFSFQSSFPGTVEFHLFQMMVRLYSYDWHQLTIPWLNENVLTDGSILQSDFHQQTQ